MRRSDDDQFTAFVRAHGATLFRTAYLMTGDYQRAEDLLQTTLVRVYQRWPRVQEMHHPVGYARKVLVSQSTSWWRRRSSHEAPGLRTDPPDRVDLARDLDEHDRVWSAVLSLPPRQRAVMVLRYYEDLTQAEIAATLDTAPGTVKSHAHAASHRLAEMLAEPATPASRGGDVMTLDEQLSRAAHELADRVVAPDVDVEVVRSKARARRRRTAAGALAAVLAATVVGMVLISRGTDRAEPMPAPRPPTLGIGPVWYDSAGLHHGGVVLRTPVKLINPDGWGVLSLVRGGAVYLDPDRQDVWYHAWNAAPRIIGQSEAGPAGDPNSGFAVWFDWDGTLVVYDTLEGREISRFPRLGGVRDLATYEHVLGGNGFLHVSTHEVVWRSDLAVRRLDLVSGASADLWTGKQTPESLTGPLPVDVHDTTQYWGSLFSKVPPSLKAANRPELSLPDLEGFGRLSADGSFLLAPWNPRRPASYGSALVDTRNGQVWVLPEPNSYHWISWSYGHLALVLVGGENRVGGHLLACDGVTHRCDRLAYRGAVLLPAS